MPIPESVKVTFKGRMAEHMDFRDVVHATQAQMLDQFGDNVFQGRVIEVHIGTLFWLTKPSPSPIGRRR